MQTKNIRVVIIDDEEDACKSLSILLSQIKYVLLTGFATNIDDGFDLYTSTEPDLVFLDIEMPNENGFSLLKKLQKSGYNPNVIFVTGFKEYAIDAFDYNVFGYLLKPVDRNKLKEMLVRFRRFIQQTDSEKQYSIKVNLRNGTLFLPIDDILYLKAESNYTHFQLSKKRSEISSKNLGQYILHPLLEHFEKYGRSLFVNPKYIYKIEDRNKKITIRKDDEEIIVKV